jgi:hypothetical protein
MQEGFRMGRRLDRQGARLFAALAVAASLASAACDHGSSAVPPGDDASIADASSDPPPDGDPPDGDGAPGADPPGDGGPAAASLDTTSLSFSSIPCGGSASTQSLHIKNTGSGTLAVSATAVGTGFTVAPAVLSVAPGAVGVLTVSASADSSATAGVKLSGSLELFTNDPQNAHTSVSLSGTPTGAALSFTSTGGKSFAFPATQVNVAAPQISLTLVNSGNAPGTFALGAPSDSHFTFVPGVDGGQEMITLNPGATYTLAADFTPTNTSPLTASASVRTSAATCGGSLQSITFSGQGAVGVVNGWPATVDFGPADCGGSAPPSQSFTLSNSGSVNATLTSVKLTGTPGFSTDALVGLVIPAGGSHPISVTAPAVPVFTSLSPVTATLSLQTDADPSPHLITLLERPSGAVLAFDTSQTTGFGSFGPVVLLRSASQSFRVVNSGTGAASVALSVTSGGEAGSASFQISTPAFTLPGGATQDEILTFGPTSALPTTAQLAMTATGAVCSSLPSSLSLAGSGIGGAPTITSTSLTFTPICGGSAPPVQSFLVRNDGNADMTWTLGPVSGVGAGQYSVQASPPPGLLIPGASASVLVSAAAVPSPAANPNPSAYAAQLTITTDIPLDPPHVVTLGETPMGDQLAFGVASPVRFGQVPIGTSLSQTLGVVNAANPGSPRAAFSLQLGGPGASAYAVSPSSVGTENLSFSPTNATPYPASLSIVTADPLCTPLPQPLVLSGTGTQGVVSVSATTLAFGTDPLDPAGLVNCGATGLPHQLTISNLGNQALMIKGLALGKGSGSPFTLSGPAASAPLSIGIGQSSTLTITPIAVPANVANPDDPSPFTDTLTITSDAALDTPHVVQLVMQARGAVIANTPLATNWTFGTISAGGIATFTSTIQNTGNASALVTLRGVAHPSVFGLAGNPTMASANAVTSIVGQFTPPSADGSWTDQGVLTVTTTQAFCAPLPPAWSAPTISLAGTSNGSPPVAISGQLTFPTTNCSSAAPAGQAVLVSNGTGAALGYTAQLSSGLFYSLSSTAGTLPASGTMSIVVTPRTLTPGPGVQPGSAPYADNLVVTVATSPPTTLTVPVSWTLNGAVLTLPEGAGPNVDAQGNFYVADTMSGFSLPLGNTGTATAYVYLAVQPFGAFEYIPVSPIEVLPGIGASPQLVSSSTAPVCPATRSASATFVYSGAVCQPLPLPSVRVLACTGTY